MQLVEGVGQSAGARQHTQGGYAPQSRLLQLCGLQPTLQPVGRDNRKPNKQ